MIKVRTTCARCGTFLAGYPEKVNGKYYCRADAEKESISEKLNNEKQKEVYREYRKLFR